MSVRTPAQALAAIQADIKNNVNIGTGDCQLNSHEVYGIGGGFASALLAWEGAKYKHTDLSTAPDGAFVYFNGGQTMVLGQPAGHVAIKLGDHIYTPGGPRNPDHWYLTTIADLEQGWPWHKVVGWTEDINGVRVPGLAPVVKSDGRKPAPASTPHIDAAVVDTETAIKRNKPGSTRRTLRGVLATLKKLSTKY